jgi:hypothetical protein
MPLHFVQRYILNEQLVFKFHMEHYTTGVSKFANSKVRALLGINSVVQIWKKNRDSPRLHKDTLV